MFSKNFQILNSTKIRPVGAELFQTDGQRDGRTDITKKIVASRNFSNSLKNMLLLFMKQKLLNEIHSSRDDCTFVNVFRLQRY
jgi:hypothetical protein